MRTILVQHLTSTCFEGNVDVSGACEKKNKQRHRNVTKCKKNTTRLIVLSFANKQKLKAFCDRIKLSAALLERITNYKHE